MSNSPLSPGLFRTPFSREYWKAAFSEVKNLKMLVLAALFVALRIVIAAFFIPVGENMRIYFSFFVNALGSLIYGPVVALMTGFAADIIGFLLQPTGAFFPGYTLSTMMGAFLYALFFYRARITWLRVFLGKASVNIFVNILMGSLWSAIIYGKGYYYYLVKSVIKNLSLLPLEALVLIVFFQLVLTPTAAAGIAPRQPTARIPLW